MLSGKDLVQRCTRMEKLLSALMSLLLATTITGFPLESVPTGSNEVMVDEGVWSEWREWMLCTRSCGAGVSIQNRTCLRGNCSGPSIQYMSCCLQDCPPNHLDFRAEQCQEYNEEPHIQYVPTEEGNEGCSLSCVNPRVTYSTLLTYVRDGTSCKTVEGYDGTCLGTMCARVGCDGVLASDKIEDECLQCHSPRDGPPVVCQQISATSTPNQAAMQGNLLIVVIPEGATTITISHPLLPNEGTLALKSSLGTYYYTNGMTDSLKNVAGAEFQREVNESGPFSEEILTSRGPLSEQVTVELQGVHQAAPVVKYEYYFTGTPDSGEGIHSNHSVEIDVSVAEPGSDYEWKYGPFSSCPVTCGKGVVVSTASCKDLLHPGRNLPDKLCQQALDTPKPLPIVQQCQLQECKPTWSAREWSKCTKSCGSGTQRRRVSCLKFVQEGSLPKQLLNDQCDPNTRPEDERSCNSQACYAEWRVGAWSQCPTQCGRWDQHRSVVCLEVATGREVNSTHCDSTRKPSKKQQCIVPCSECYWATSKYGKCDNACGYGVQTRRIRCRYVINNHRANESCCEGQELPVRTQPCYDTRGSRCTPDWVTHAYGQCEGDCCGEMKKERQVECGKMLSSGELVIFPDRECNETTKPQTSMACVRTDCPRWRTAEWEQCSETCGNGNRFRDVRCVQGDNLDQTLLDESCECSGPKPPRVQSCSDLPTCPPDVQPTNGFSTCDLEVEKHCQDDPLACCESGTLLRMLCPLSCQNRSNS